MPQKNIRPSLLILVLGLVLIAMAFFWGAKKDATNGVDPAPVAAVEVPAPMPTDAAAPSPEQQTPVPETADTGTKFEPVVMPVGDTIGRDDAPVKIVEYSSLTCGHCAHFHTKVLDELRVKYVDTGSVQIIFREFPLNKPALDASKLLRCLPPEQYFGFMSLLFQTQEHWAHSPDYLAPLKQNAKLAGLSAEQIDTCLADKDAEAKIAEHMADVTKKYEIGSTPTFVLNDGADKVIGAVPAAEFAKKIDALLPSSSTNKVTP